MSITRASLSVMILKSALQYSLLITRPCFTRKATLPLAPVERSLTSSSRTGIFAQRARVDQAVGLYHRKENLTF